MRAVVREEHYGVHVWVSPDAETARRSACLCLHCARMGIACETARSLYAICVAKNVAFAVSRCPLWKEPRTSTEKEP